MVGKHKVLVQPAVLSLAASFGVRDFGGFHKLINTLLPSVFDGTYTWNELPVETREKLGYLLGSC